MKRHWDEIISIARDATWGVSMAKLAASSFLHNSDDRISPEEWDLRVNLAACYRLMDRFGMTDMIYNHISARIPGTEHFLINPYGLLYTQITASTLIKVDLNGTIISKSDDAYSVNMGGFTIHSAVHAARPDVHCVIHTHTRAGMAVSALKCGLLPISQTAMRFSDIAYHDYEGVTIDTDECARLSAHLGNRNAMILRNHGLMVCAESIPQAFNAIYWLERACQIQIDALSCNRELEVPPLEIIEKTRQTYIDAEATLEKNASPGAAQKAKSYGFLEWPALIRALDQTDQSYRS